MEKSLADRRIRARVRVRRGSLTSRAQTKASDKEWAAVVEAAKKEGKVVVAGSPDPVMRNEIIPKFTARFGIPVEFVAGRSSQIVARVKTERAREFIASTSISPARTPRPTCFTTTR